jgi:hypothetical protein
MQIIRDADYQGSPLLSDVSNPLYLANNPEVPVNTTFIAFPYDIFEKDDFQCQKVKTKLSEIDAMVNQVPPPSPYVVKKVINDAFKELGSACGAQLDHIFTRNLNKVGEAILAVTPLFSPNPAIYTESNVKKYILDHCDEGPAYASDHQPTKVELEVVISGDVL